MTKQLPQFIIAAPTSNSGKTTITLGLLRALENRGIVTQPFKVGPDYIDPKFHKVACGKNGLNLDLFMTTSEDILNTYAKYSADKGAICVEGVMGLFDGARKSEGSTAEVAKLLEDERLDKILSQLLGEYWIMYAFTGSSCPPNGTNYGGRVHVDCPRWIENYTTNVGVIWALDDFTVENGGTKVLPASHHADFIPTKEYFEKNAIQVECKKGSLIIFNARVVHSTGFNETENWRHALTMNACRSYMKQRMDWVRFIPNEISDKLNQRARRIIGFDTRLPTSLEEFFLPEEQRLYKPNQG